MRRYLPYIGVVWGAAIILHAAVNGFAFSGNGSYRAGSFLAFLFGVAMVLAGGQEIAKKRRHGGRRAPLSPGPVFRNDP